MTDKPQANLSLSYLKSIGAVVDSKTYEKTAHLPYLNEETGEMETGEVTVHVRKLSAGSVRKVYFEEDTKKKSMAEFQLIASSIMESKDSNVPLLTFDQICSLDLTVFSELARCFWETQDPKKANLAKTKSFSNSSQQASAGAQSKKQKKD